MMEKILELIKYMNEKMETLVIFQNQGELSPRDDEDDDIENYITVQVVDYNQKKRKSIKKLKENSMVETTMVNHVNATLQFNCLGENLIKSKELALEVYDFFSFKERENLWDKGFGVCGIGQINDMTTLLEETEYKHLNTIDITMEFERSSIKTIENLNSITINDDEIIVRR